MCLCSRLGLTDSRATQAWLESPVFTFWSDDGPLVLSPLATFIGNSAFPHADQRWCHQAHFLTHQAHCLTETDETRLQLPTGWMDTPALFGNVSMHHYYRSTRSEHFPCQFYHLLSGTNMKSGYLITRVYKGPRACLSTFSTQPTSKMLADTILADAHNVHRGYIKLPMRGFHFTFIACDASCPYTQAETPGSGESYRKQQAAIPGAARVHARASCELSDTIRFSVSF